MANNFSALGENTEKFALWWSRGGDRYISVEKKKVRYNEAPGRKRGLGIQKIIIKYFGLRLHLLSLAQIESAVKSAPILAPDP